MRDQALAISGLLQPAIGGPPVKPYQPDNVWEPVGILNSNTGEYHRDTGPALYRRSLYTFWKRTAPPPSLIAFDAPSREASCLRRDRTDTPLQALALMNDVQQFEAARAFAERLLTAPGNEAARLALGFQLATGRLPTDGERTLLADALAGQRAHFATDAGAAAKVLGNGESKPTHALPPAEFAAWTLVANLLLNLDETLESPTDAMDPILEFLNHQTRAANSSAARASRWAGSACKCSRRGRTPPPRRGASSRPCPDSRTLRRAPNG